MLTDTLIKERALASLKENLRAGYSESLYLESRKLYVATKGKFNNDVNKLIGQLRPPMQYKGQNDILHGKFNAQKIAESLYQQGGYLKLNLDLGQEIYDEIRNALDDADNQVMVAPEISSRTFISEWNSLKKFKLTQIILSSRLLKSVADTYLGCNSVISMIIAWKSRAITRSEELMNRDALQFHFDCDHNRFLKLFIYLSDVDHQCGPHVAIPFTGGAYFFSSLPPDICQDRRLSNIEILNTGLNPHVFCGPQGTLLLGDTANLHRGTPVYQGRSRYLLQIQYSDTIFGAQLAHSYSEIINMNRLHIADARNIQQGFSSCL
jgi:hypothetical protein